MASSSSICGIVALPATRIIGPVATAAPPTGPSPRAGGLAALTPSGRAVVPAAWALYDLANTIFTYSVVSYAMGLWTIDRLGPADGQFWFGVAAAASVLLNAIVSPILGAVSDRGGRRLPYLLVFTAITVVATALIAFVDAAAIGLVLFAIANFAYQAALIYYDATLPVVAKPEARGRMSGIGVAVGYLGTLIIAGLILITGSGAEPLTFLMAAGLFTVFAIPIFVFVKEQAVSDYRFQLRDVLSSWSQLGTTLRHASEVPGLLRFLVGRFFYTDPVNTVIVVMTVFATEAIGLSRGDVNIVLLLLTVVAVFASLGWGRLVERIGPKRTLLIVLGTWCVGLLIVGARPVVPDVPDRWRAAGRRAGRRLDVGPGAHAAAVTAGQGRRVLRPVRDRRASSARSPGRCCTGRSCRRC